MRSNARPFKVVALVISVLTIALALGGVVWAAASLVGSKADREEVENLKDRVGDMREDISVIKTEQRVLIRDVRRALRREQ